MAQVSRWTLPEVVNPPDSLCVLIPVPNDRYHIAAFLGAIYQLTRPYSWQNDTAHTALAVGAVWQPIFDALRLQMCSDFDCPITIEESEIDVSVCEQIRFNPATGLFEGWCCGSWSAISGQPSNGFAPNSAPMNGSPVPGAGQCTVYQGTLNANEQWLCPAVVNTGDTIQITVLRGAWTDGSGIWYGPNSTTYFGGIYVPNTIINGADPLPASPHMGILSKINGAYHYLGDLASFTVPAGVVNKLLILQANDATLSDDSGQITFSITVCNNQPLNWTSIVDFRVSNYGSYALGSGGTVTYTPGVGWVFSLPVTSSGYSVELDHAAATIIGVQNTVVATTVVLPSGSNQLRKLTPTVTLINPLVDAGSGTQVKTYSNPSGLSSTGLNWTMAGSVPGDGSGSWVLQKVLITGTGTKPATLP